MKNVLYMTVLILFVSSCKQNNSSNVDPGPLSYVSSEISIDAEQNLKDQLKEYNDALHGEPSRPERVLDFIYSDSFTYLERQNPRTYSKEMVISLFNEPVKQLKKMARENNVTYNTRVGEIVQKVNEGKRLIYKVELFLDMEYGIDKHTTGDKILGISLDGGENWKFLEINPESTPEILSIKFSKTTIDKVI